MDYPPNVILIVVDTLRDDYSYPLKENLKKFGFISYNNAIAPTSWTIPSHASLFTGLYPPLLHKIHETKHKKNPDIRFDDLPPEITLQHFLGELGYESYLLSANPYISPPFLGYLDLIISMIHIRGNIAFFFLTTNKNILIN